MFTCGVRVVSRKSPPRVDVGAIPPWEEPASVVPMDEVTDFMDKVTVPMDKVTDFHLVGAGGALSAGRAVGGEPRHARARRGGRAPLVV